MLDNRLFVWEYFICGWQAVRLKFTPAPAFNCSGFDLGFGRANLVVQPFGSIPIVIVPVSVLFAETVIRQAPYTFDLADCKETISEVMGEDIKTGFFERFIAADGDLNLDLDYFVFFRAELDNYIGWLCLVIVFSFMPNCIGFLHGI